MSPSSSTATKFWYNAVARAEMVEEASSEKRKGPPPKTPAEKQKQIGQGRTSRTSRWSWPPLILIVLTAVGGVALAWLVGYVFNEFCFPDDAREVPICVAFRGGGPWPLILTGIAAGPSVLLTWYWRDTGRRTSEKQKRQDIRQAQLNYKLEIQAKIADRFQAASSMLVADNPLSRIAGLHALWDIARESEAHRLTVRMAMAAFIRVRAPIPDNPDYDDDPHVYPPRPEVHVALVLLFDRVWGEWIPGGTADLRLTHLAASNLRGAYMKGVDLEGAELYHSNLDEADLSHSNLKGANLFKASLVRANLSQVDARGAQLSEARLNSANCRSINLAGCRLEKTQLRHADLTHASLISVEAEEADFRNATLKGSKFHAANLKKVIFVRANLNGAKLLRVDLTGADLSDANVTGAKNDGARTEGAKLPEEWK